MATVDPIRKIFVFAIVVGIATMGLSVKINSFSLIYAIVTSVVGFCLVVVGLIKLDQVSESDRLDTLGTTSRTAPPGKFRLTGYNKHDQKDYYINDFRSLKAARKEAISRASKPNGNPVDFSDDFLIFDDQDLYQLKVSSSNNGPVELYGYRDLA